MMAYDRDYHNAINQAVSRIRSTVPANLVDTFVHACGINREDFHGCPPMESGEVCAIDGSNVILLSSGSMALAAVRAAQTTFTDMKRTRRSITHLKFALLGPEPESTDFLTHYFECFGEVPGKPLLTEDKEAASGIVRDTFEYWVTELMAKTLGPGSLLLRDGPLRVAHASHDAVLERIEGICQEKTICLAGISKATSATWGGGHPLLPSVHGLAKLYGVVPPWWIRIDSSILDHAQYAQWQHGQMYVACLHPHAMSPLKIDLLKNQPYDVVSATMCRLAGCSADGRIPGYPYPLFDAHRTVVLTEEVVEQILSDIMEGMASSGIDRQTYDILFGDYHDAFARY